MKKFIYPLLALVLACSLGMVTAVPVAAQADGSLYLVSSGGTGGVATWSTTPVKLGTYSAALAGGTDGGASYGQVWAPVNIPLVNITDVSFWYYLSSTAQADYSAWPVYKQEGQTYTDGTGYVTPYVTLEISDGTDTHWVISQPFARDPDGGWTAGWEQWSMSDNASEYPVTSGMDPDQALWHDESFTDNATTGGSGAYPAGWEYLSYFQSLYGGYNVVKLKIAMGWWAFTTDQSAYVDDMTINTATYELERPPEPLTVDDDRVECPDAYFQTIQGAIDCAVAGETVLVYDGTYQESISVTTSDLTLRSVNGRDSTTIENVGNVTYPPEAAQCGFLIRGPANNFTLGGAADQGFTFSGGTSPRLIQLNNAPSGVEISHNTVNTTGTASTGILIGAAGATGLTVSNNIFIADEDACQDWPLIASSLSGSVLDVTVTANEFTGSGTPEKYGAAIDLENVSGVSTFSSNIISAFDRGIIVDGTTSGLDVSGNSISNCGKGVLFRPGTHAEMVNNTFADNTYNIYHAAEIVTGGSDFYGNIQDAIDPADPGDTILVYAGLYEESISIDKSLTVQSEAGAVDEEWDIVTELHGYVDIVLGVVGGNAAAETVVFDGFYMEEQEVFIGVYADNGSDATISNNVLDTCYAGIWLHDVDNGSSVTVSNNTIMYYGCGIMSGAPTTDNASSVTIEGNKIFYGEVGICFDAVAGGSELTIRDNVVAENDCGIAFYDVDESTVTIAGNTIGEWYSEEWGEYFYGNHSCGIYFSGPTTVSGSTITIGGDTRAEGNVISDNGWVSDPWYGGIRVEYLEASDLEILNNDILYNHYGGVEIWDFDEDSTVDIHYNSIVGNDSYGVSYDSPYLIDATCNWWGDVAGPSRYTNPCYWTSGDYVSSSVDYIPWLIQSDLAEDWNIWSAPIAPDAASWAQMQAELVEDGIVDIYYYDSATQYWGADADDAGPLDAYYIKMPAESRIRYCINDEATFPGQKDMKIGWNFIGLADLHPGMGLESALLDVYYGTGVAEGLWGLSKVISPSLNPESWTYQRGGTPHPLFTTKGYWVFMVNDGVLGGFTETPIVEVEGDGGP